MDIQVAALCDSAADYDGKLCLLGTFDTIIAAYLPAVHPQCSLALRFIFRKEHEGRHTITVNLVDEDGKGIVPPIEAILDVALPEELFFQTRNVVLNLQQLKFDQEGLYSFEVAANGGSIMSIPLQVVRATEGSPPY